MDPMENLHQQLTLAHAMIDAAEQIADGAEVELTVSDESLELAELVIAMHQWRASGGFDPYIQTRADSIAQRSAFLERERKQLGNLRREQ